MSSTNIKRIVFFALSLVVGVLATSTALAHGGPPRVEVYPAQAAPGAELNVRGINIGSDAQVDVLLVGEGGEHRLGTATCDGVGDFDLMFKLPDELATGEYTVQVVAAGGSMLSTQVQVARPGLRELFEKLKDIPVPALFGGLAVVMGIAAVVLRQREARAST
jgi:hypothetical protein